MSQIYVNDFFLIAETTQQAEFTGLQVERPRLIRRNTFTKLEGDITSETTSSLDFRHYQNVERTTKVQRREDNIVLGEETFQVNSQPLDSHSYLLFFRKITTKFFSGQYSKS